MAHEDNLSIINDNPAGLVWMEEGFHAELSSDFLLRDVRYRDPLRSDTSDEGCYLLPQLAVAGRIPDVPVAVGLSVFLPGGYGAEYELDHAILGRQDYESEGTLLKVLPSLAVRLGDYVSIGAGIGLAYSTAEFKAPYTFQTGPLAGQTGLIDLDTSAVAVTGNFGIQIRPTDRLTIGAAYISETFTKQEGDFVVDVTDNPFLAPLLSDPMATYDVDFDLRWPRSVAVGASYRFDRGRLSVDGLWYNWRDAFEKFRFKLSNSDNPEYDALVGARPQDDFPLDWEDSYSVRAGYGHTFGEHTTARIGYIYNTNPIPDRTLTPLLPGILEHSFAAGVGHDFGLFDVNFAYQYSLGEVRDVERSALLGGDFDNSTMKAQAHWIFLSVAADF